MGLWGYFQKGLTEGRGPFLKVGGAFQWLSAKRSKGKQCSPPACLSSLLAAAVLFPLLTDITHKLLWPINVDWRSALSRNLQAFSTRRAAEAPSFGDLVGSQTCWWLLSLLGININRWGIKCFTLYYKKLQIKKYYTLKSTRSKDYTTQWPLIWLESPFKTEATALHIGFYTFSLKYIFMYFFTSKKWKPITE